MQFCKLSFARQIYLFGTVSVLVTMGALAFYYREISSQRLETRKMQLQAAVETAGGVVDYFVSQHRLGALTNEAAKQAGLAALFSLRPTGVGALWVIDTRGHQLLRPTGKASNLSQATSFSVPVPSGLAAAVSEHARGGGADFISFRADMSKGDAPAELAYVMSYPEWQWLVGGTAPMAGADLQLSGLRFTMLAVLLFVTLLVVAATWLFSRNLLRPMRQALAIIYRISHGELNEVLPMGVPVNCSQAKKCGKQDCPAFGKVEYCWVTAGSFAVIKKCPHAMKGGLPRLQNVRGSYRDGGIGRDDRRTDHQPPATGRAGHGDCPGRSIP